MDNFAKWLDDQLDERSWKPADLARESGLKAGVISNILNGHRNLGEKTGKAVARALKLPADLVFQKAGILPSKPPETELINEITHLTLELPPPEQKEVLEYIKHRHRLVEQREKNETKRTRSKAAIP